MFIGIDESLSRLTGALPDGAVLHFGAKRTSEGVWLFTASAECGGELHFGSGQTPAAVVESLLDAIDSDSEPTRHEYESQLRRT